MQNGIKLKSVVVDSTADHLPGASKEHDRRMRQHNFPWRPGRLQKCSNAARTFLLSPDFVASGQLAVATFVITLFILVRQLYFTDACYATIFMVISLILIPQDTHLGSKMQGAALTVGLCWPGLVASGAVLSIAHAFNLFTIPLCLFASLGIVVGSIIRAYGGLGAGILFNLGLVLPIVGGQFISSYASTWHLVLDWFMSSLIGALGTLVAALLFLPSLAAQEINQPACEVLTGIGHAMSGYASHIFTPANDRYSHVRQHPGFSSSKPDVAEELVSANGSQDVDSALLNDRTMTASRKGEEASCEEEDHHDEYESHMQASHAGRDEDKLQQQQHESWLADRHTRPSIVHLRPAVLLAKRLLSEARVEPPLLRRSCLPVGKWGAVLNALDSMITRTAALEPLMSGEKALLDDAVLRSITGGMDVLSIFQMLSAQIAASCMKLAACIRDSAEHKSQNVQLGFQPGWGEVQLQLAATLHAALRRYWPHIRLHGELSTGSRTPASVQLRVLLYVTSLTAGIMEAMAKLEHAVIELLGASHEAARDSDSSDEGDSSPQGHAMLNPVLTYGAPTAVGMDQPAGQDDPFVNGLHHSRRDSAEVHVPEAVQPAGQMRDDSAVPEDIDPFDATSGLISFRRQPREKLLQRWSEADLVQNLSQRRMGVMRPSGSSHRQDENVTARGRTDGKLPEAQANRQGSQQRVKANAAEHRKRVWHHWIRPRVKWLFPLLQGLSGRELATCLWQVLADRIPSTLRTAQRRKTFWQSRRFQFFVKYCTVFTLTLVVVLILSRISSGFRSWSPNNLLLTIVVVMSEKIELTVSKGVLRIFGTLVGGLFGYIVMLRSSVATSPYAIMALQCAFSWLLGLFSMGTFRYAVFLTLIASSNVILCNYVIHAPPGYHGTVKTFYSRVAGISLGVVIVFLCDLILPWYTSTAAMEELGGAFEQSMGVLQQFYQAFYEELELSGAASKSDGDVGVAKLKHNLIQQKLAAPLSSVQASLARETVVWRQGLLVMPPIVRTLVTALQRLQDRLSALELSILQKPVISGRYTQHAFVFYVQPLHSDIQTALAAAQVLGKATADLLGDRASEANLDEVAAKQEELAKCRHQVTEHYARQRMVFQSLVKARDPATARSLDDPIRFMSTMFALREVLSQADEVTKMALADPWVRLHSKERRRQTMHLWLGL